MNVLRTRRSRSSSNPVSPEAHEPRGHRPVLLHEVVELLDVQQDDVVFDATLGGAGHAAALAARLGVQGVFVGFDLDADALARARTALAESKASVHLVEANFRDVRTELTARGITAITKALFDLGWSSYQLDSGRGFSLSADEPLSMNFSQQADALTAAIVVNTWQEETLADIIYGFGQERYARRIAKAIVERRGRTPFVTARELAECIVQAVPAAYAYGRIHPATRTFQALRMAVNDELGALSQGIADTFDMLAPGGRIAVITFHSVEDRAVKQLFVALERQGKGRRLTKKPLTASADELAGNRRARSAKLRVFEKTFAYDQETSQNKQIQGLGTPGEI